jgi:hypothetical protein
MRDESKAGAYCRRYTRTGLVERNQFIVLLRRNSLECCIAWKLTYLVKEVSPNIKKFALVLYMYLMTGSSIVQSNEYHKVTTLLESPL